MSSNAPPATPSPAPQAQSDQDGLPLAAASEVIEQLRQQGDSCQEKKKNQRKSERRAWVTQLTLLIEDPLGKQRTLDVATHDISTGGFSFIYKQFIHINTKVAVLFETLPGKPALNGVVRSCVLLDGMHHRIGVQFHIPRTPQQGKPAGPSTPTPPPSKS